MGIGPSAPAAPTTQTPMILNFILREMFRRADLMDLYSLADPSRCSKYIVVATNALETLFVRLQIYPERGKDGLLYFQSIDGIAKSMPKEIRDKQRAHCVELAFFFIRIFQIFGALTLSMLDTQLPVADPYDDIPTDAAARGRAQFLRPQDFAGIAMTGPSMAKPARQGWFGGALTQRDAKSFYIPDGDYRILNYHLKVPEAGQSAMTPLKIEGFPITVTQRSLYEFTGDDALTRKVKSVPAPSIDYLFTRNSNTYTVTGELKIVQSGDNFAITLSNFALDGDRRANIFPKKEVLRRLREDDIPVSTGQNFPQVKNKTLPYVLQAMFESAAVDMLGEPPFSVLKLLRKFQYVSGSPEADTTLTGTHITIPGGQENASTVRILYRNSEPLGENGRKIPVTIRADLSISKPRFSVTDNTYTYEVMVDFSRVQVTPSTAADTLQFKQYRSSKFTAFSKEAVPKSERGDGSIPEYVEGVFQDVLRSSGEDGAGRGRLQYTREGLPKPYDSDQIPEDMRIRRLWQALAKDPPVKAHCVARAAQLLSVAAIRGQIGERTFSSACRLNFAYQKDGSLPTPGRPITDAAGIYGLAMLFVSGLENGVPKIVDAPKYKEFLKFLKYAFELYPKLADTPTPAKIGEITEKHMPFCQDLGDSRVEIPKALAQQLRGITSELLRQQSAHMSAAMNVIFMLFDKEFVTNKKQFALNPTILKGGMAEVNRIAGLARDVLLKYYSDCENKYREGLFLMLKADEATPLIAVPKFGEAPVSSTRPAPSAPPGP